MEPKSPLESLFRSQGEEFSIPAHYRCVAEEDENIWFLAEGEADLFFVDVSEANSVILNTPLSPEQLNGRLTFIHHAVPGDYLFPFKHDPQRHTHLLVRANTHCRWLKLPKNK